MARKYRHSNPVKGDGIFNVAVERFWEWNSKGNETIICLNGGMAADVAEAHNKFATVLGQSSLPYEIFHEESRAFGNGQEQFFSPTTWGVVLPEELYSVTFDTEKKAFVNSAGTLFFDEGDILYEFLIYKNSCSMAR